MINFNDYQDKQLKIIQKSFWKNEFHLADEDIILGTLKSVKLWNDLYLCTIDDKEFEFYKKSVFSNEIHIKEKLKELPFAKFESNFFFTSGKLRLDRGRNLLVKIGTFKNNVSINESETKQIIKLDCKVSLDKRCILKIENKSEILTENPWILLFAFYLIKASHNSGMVFH
jgi:hypothetical protein